MSLAPTPENNLILRQMRELRRNQLEAQERDARIIELIGRMNGRLDEMMARTDSRLNEIRSDLVQMEMRVLTAITEVRLIAARLDEGDDGDDLAPA